MSRWLIRTYDSRIVLGQPTQATKMIYTFKFIQMDLKTVTIVAIMVAVAVIGIQETEARPSSGHTETWNPFERRSGPYCENVSEATRGLCQRCAKVTKSRLAYKMCCENEDETQIWCTKFLSFGITNQNSNSL